MRGQGRSRLSLQDRMVRLQGAWDATLGSPDFRWAPPEAWKGERPRPSSEPEDIRGEGTRQEAEDQAGTHCRHSGGRHPGWEQRSRSSKGEQASGAAQKVKPAGPTDETWPVTTGAAPTDAPALRPSAADHANYRHWGPGLSS